MVRAAPSTRLLKRRMRLPPSHIANQRQPLAAHMGRPPATSQQALCRPRIGALASAGSVEKQLSQATPSGPSLSTSTKCDGPASSDARSATAKQLSARDQSALSEVVPSERALCTGGDARTRGRQQRAGSPASRRGDCSDSSNAAVWRSAASVLRSREAVAETRRPASAGGGNGSISMMGAFRRPLRPLRPPIGGCGASSGCASR
jgi:hypothetical protein